MRYSAIFANIGSVAGRDSMFTRGMQHHIDEQIISDICEKTHKMTKISAMTVGGANAISKVSSKAGGEIAVSGGWGSDREVVTVLIKDASTMDMIYITGFTDPNCRQDENSININPDSSLRLNTVTIFEPKNVNGKIKYTGTKADLTLSLATLTAPAPGTNNERILNSRPRDLLNAATYTGDGDTLTCSGMSSEALDGGRLAKAADISPAHVMAAALTAVGNSSVSEQSLGISQNITEITENTLQGSISSSVVNENEIRDNNFVDALLTGEGANRRTVSVTFEKLFDLVPNMKFQSVGKVGFKPGQNLASWKGNYSGIPAEIANTLSGMMIHGGVQSASFAFSNLSRDESNGMDHVFKWNGDGDSTTFIRNVDIDKLHATITLEACIRNLLIPQIARGRKITGSIDCNIASDLSIELEIDGHSMSIVGPLWAIALCGIVKTDETQSLDSAKALFRSAKMLTDLSKGIQGSGSSLNTRTLTGY